jgi:hypothetical protein
MRTKLSLIPNLDHEIGKTKTKTWHMQNKNPTRFYCKKGIEKGYDKEMYPKLVLNRQKVTWNSTSIYTP